MIVLWSFVSRFLGGVSPETCWRANPPWLDLDIVFFSILSEGGVRLRTDLDYASRSVPSSSLKVLVVDDDPDNLRMVSRFLGSKGIAVVTTDSPFAVNGLLREEEPDIVILDVMMPALDGETVARFIRAASNSSKPMILFYSAMGESELKALTDRVPGSIFLAKTAGLVALHDAVVEAHALPKE
jgi:two-component system OmpR family response regulator